MSTLQSKMLVCIVMTSCALNFLSKVSILTYLMFEGIVIGLFVLVITFMDVFRMKSFEIDNQRYMKYIREHKEKIFTLPSMIYDLYPSQKKFISDAKEVIENGGVGIFSSPTGTGKTLSLLLSIIDELSDDLLGLDEVKTRVYYCSRTHSQLSQAINEFRRLDKTYNSVVLGSRSVYCINPAVNTLQPDAMNEKCYELVKNKACPYYGDEIYLTGVQDIEDLVSAGKQQMRCPFYLSRHYSKKCEIVFLPYNLLFTKEGRFSAQIEVCGCIVIVDEAHNICGSVLDMNTVQVPYNIVKKYIGGIQGFLKKKKNREVGIINDILTRIYACREGIHFTPHLGRSTTRDYASRTPGNADKISLRAYHIRDTKSISNLRSLNESNSGCEDEINEKIISTSEFLIATELYDYNMLDIEDFAYKYNLAAKLEGYGSNLNMQLCLIIKFLRLLVMSDSSSRIFYTEKYLRFVPLDPKIYFAEISRARSILFTGGTMEPVDQLMTLFRNRAVYFSYDTVCDNFLPLILSTGPSGTEMILDYNNRTRHIVEVIKTLVELCTVVKKGGILCFVPSKSFLLSLKSVMNEKMPLPVLYEDENTFTEYIIKVRKSPVMLIAVMGGKLSEGVNFNDGLCRLLVIVGVPYPNITPEVEAKVEFYGNDYIQHLAMRTVNQTIGRSIRHKNDYACVILIDRRYQKLKSLLSEWIKKRIAAVSFNDALAKAKDFLQECEF